MQLYALSQQSVVPLCSMLVGQVLVIHFDEVSVYLRHPAWGWAKEICKKTRRGVARHKKRAEAQTASTHFPKEQV